MTHKLTMVLVAITVACAEVLAQGSAGTGSNIEPRYVVDVPTAGMLPKASFAMDMDFYQEGGVLFGLSVGVLDQLSIGLSYGGSRLLGADEPIMNELPGVNVKVRIVEEGEDWPAIALGFDSQGRDGFLKDLDRYQIKSPGFYAALSRNYSLLGNLSVHGGINYSLERGDDDEDANVFAGVEKSIGSVFSLLMEYNVAANDSHAKAVGRGRGYLNFGARWSVGGGFTLGFNLKDIIKNGGDISVANRTVRLEYIRFF
ncbi:MAG: hypothetical protein ACKVRP_16005 [Bacteroidota bacterium]